MRRISHILYLLRFGCGAFIILLFRGKDYEKDKRDNSDQAKDTEDEYECSSIWAIGQFVNSSTKSSFYYISHLFYE